MEAQWHVPSYETAEFRKRRHRYCVAVFVIDEGQRLLDQLDRMSPLADVVDIFVADGGSTDGSTSEEGLRQRDVAALLTKRGEGRLGTQMRMAFHYALENGYEGVITIDGNGKDDVRAMPLFVAALSEGLDHVQGSRFIQGGREVNTPRSRLWGVRLLHAPAISLSAGIRYTDTTNGFRAYSARLLLDPRVAPFRNIFVGYELHYYLAIRAARLGFRCKEVPTTRSYPSDGPTPTKIHGFKGNASILEALARACFHGFNPPTGRSGSDR